MTKQAALHIAVLIAELKARAANATGEERAKLLGAVKYYQDRQR